MTMMDQTTYIEGQGYVLFEGIKINPCPYCNHTGIDFDTDCDNDQEELLYVAECAACNAYSEGKTYTDAVIKWNNGDISN